jgi:hypothetical protein
MKTIFFLSMAIWVGLPGFSSTAQEDWTCHEGDYRDIVAAAPQAYHDAEIDTSISLLEQAETLCQDNPARLYIVNQYQTVLEIGSDAYDQIYAGNSADANAGFNEMLALSFELNDLNL